MKKIILFLLIPFLTSCGNSQQTKTSSNESISDGEYGVFLGANSSSLERISNYKNVIIDIDEFEEKDINYLEDKGCEIYSYLSVGSLEKYRSYYEEFKDLTFMDYDNWPDERWVDVSSNAWQDHLVNEVNRFKNLKADGIFMDNFDVYYIAKEEYECSESFKEGIYSGCVSILNKLSETGLKLIINSGTDFLERLNEENPTLLDEIHVYAQECVYSSIVDYEKDIFGKQDDETSTYYKSIINLMKSHSKILLIEYTKDETLIDEIENFCKTNNCYYYISSSVNLN